MGVDVGWLSDNALDCKQKSPGFESWLQGTEKKLIKNKYARLRDGRISTHADPARGPCARPRRPRHGSPARATRAVRPILGFWATKVPKMGEWTSALTNGLGRR